MSKNRSRNESGFEIIKSFMFRVAKDKRNVLPGEAG